MLCVREEHGPQAGPLKFFGMTWVHFIFWFDLDRG
jgi:hypothetical protein